jgi:hypothetical protein
MKIVNFMRDLIKAIMSVTFMRHFTDVIQNLRVNFSSSSQNHADMWFTDVVRDFCLQDYFVYL